MNSEFSTPRNYFFQRQKILLLTSFSRGVLLRRNSRERGISRRATQSKPQQSIGCEDFDKEQNAEITVLLTTDLAVHCAAAVYNLPADIG